jgi:hypothetical protein
VIAAIFSIGIVGWEVRSAQDAGLLVVSAKSIANLRGKEKGNDLPEL